MNGRVATLVLVIGTMAVRVDGSASRIQAQVASALCPSDVVPSPSEYGYRAVDDRCEGEFQREVGASLDIVSLTAGRLARPNGANTALQLSWSHTGLDELRITGRVLEQHTYYRMDAKPSHGASTFAWPLTRLSGAGYGAKRLAIKLTGTMGSGAARKRVYVPVRALYDSAQVTDGPLGYTLVLLSGDEVQTISASMTDVAGGTTNTVWTNQSVAKGPFAPTYPISVTIPASSRGPGLYRVDLVARTRLSIAAPLRFELLHD